MVHSWTWGSQILGSLSKLVGDGWQQKDSGVIVVNRKQQVVWQSSGVTSSEWGAGNDFGQVPLPLRDVHRKLLIMLITPSRFLPSPVQNTNHTRGYPLLEDMWPSREA